MENDQVQAEVAYASESKQYLIPVILPIGSTVNDAIQTSDILTCCPEIDLTQQRVGIFGRICALTDEVKNGDRIEIYRPLKIDPKAARRIKAAFS